MQPLPTFLVLILLALIGIEMLWARTHSKPVFKFGETLANLGVLLGNQALKPLTFAWKGLVFGWAQHYALDPLPTTPVWVLVAFLLVELNYYWYHRLSHEWSLLWTVHHTHHSGSTMNFTTSIRLSWLGGFVAPFFFLPLILLGFSPTVVLGSLAFGLLYQFFLHTEAFRTWGRLEGWLNTPSAHRVHHGSNPRYIDKNYGAVLLMFDRIFGTYEPETEQVRYGVTTGLVSNNPFAVVFAPLVRWLGGRLIREKWVSRIQELEDIGGNESPMALPGHQEG